jgi:hypothetical protein
MADGDEIVGHKTFATGEICPETGMPRFRHEPLTRKEADALWQAVEAAKAKRVADMPTEQDAVNALWSAQQRLKELGWDEPRGYSVRELREEGKEAMLIEFSSSGIHRGHYHAVKGDDVWWIGPDGSPSHPCLVRATSAPSSTTAER